VQDFNFPWFACPLHHVICLSLLKHIKNHPLFASVLFDGRLSTVYGFSMVCIRIYFEYTVIMTIQYLCVYVQFVGSIHRIFSSVRRKQNTKCTLHSLQLYVYISDPRLPNIFHLRKIRQTMKLIHVYSLIKKNYQMAAGKLYPERSQQVQVSV
jgi:uncharacterized membrane protein